MQATDAEENANELQFGEIDFNSLQPISNDQLYHILTRRQQAGMSNELFNQTIQYLQKVATTDPGEALETLTIELYDKLTELRLHHTADNQAIPLHPFEVATLSNIITDADTDAEELVILVPSLGRFHADQLDKVIALVSEAKIRAAGGVTV